MGSKLDKPPKKSGAKAAAADAADRTQKPNHLDRLIGYQLRRASGVFMAGFVDLFRDVPLRPAQFAILSHVEETPGISPSELSRILAIKKTNMVPLVVELEQRGLLKRAADSKDRRVQLLTLAPGAAKQLAAWRKRIIAHEDSLLRHLSPEEREQLFGLLSKLRSSAG
ncbi:MarR family winged helix-turn-helix transcriptional regulator [Roseiterribacter gracilis]|uniref:MarR family transcriptional regulator n=1 Tax=Roseiterribacter gracilis TaxID=2812848 RepID=A0A8S8XHV0_9PROT|nr:MarR family transcriptional regulator [Rhodospirillales bacterium TMPK1]